MSGLYSYWHQRVPIDHIELLLEKTEKIGLSSRQILRQCRFSYDLEQIREHRITHLPLQDFIRLWNRCISLIRQELSDDGDPGMCDADFQLMCHCLITSLTLREVIDRLSRFFEVADGRFGLCRLEVLDGDAALEFELGPIETKWNDFFTINALKLFTSMFSWMVGQAIPATYEITCRETPDTLATATIFGETLNYSASANRMIFSRHHLDQAVVRTPADLRTFLDHFPFDAVISQDSDTNLSRRVEGVYRARLTTQGTIPSLHQLSRTVGLSSATLRRKLDREGSSIRQIKDAVRCDLARNSLRSKNADISEIAASVGFSSSKAFSRAFKQWCGVSPTQYRLRPE